MKANDPSDVTEFGRQFFGATETFTRIGTGAIGGKASGLDTVRQKILAGLRPDEFPEIDVRVPTLTVLSTELFDAFMQHNDLYAVAISDLPDDRIAHAFQMGELPAQHVGDLRALIAGVHTPLAVRSSSLLEDALDHPFAGVYATKMIPNNQADTDTRFKKLVQAIKFVYASTFFREARSYMRSVGQDPASEKMAVIVQEIMGSRRDDRFYPCLSGVARSYNYYPSGGSRPEDGVVNLALGLGKQIVDGGISWIYSPTRPQAPSPFKDMGDLLENTQTGFWAVHMGRPPLPDPIHETEYLVHSSFDRAEVDGTLRFLVSTFDAASDRLRPGVVGDGARVLDFAPILCAGVVPLNDLVRRLLELSEDVLGTALEMEFAVDLDLERGLPARFGFLQVRPMMVSGDEVQVAAEDLTGQGLLLASESVLGNGEQSEMTDVVFVKPDVFEARFTTEIAQDLDRVNRSIVEQGRVYLLIGFGRWGSSDPWLGIPVQWGQISGARVIVESTLADMSPDLSQGSHFFHNLIGFRVLYLSVPHRGVHRIDWEWLNLQAAVQETRFVKHVRTAKPLSIKVDGRSGRGRVKYHE